MAFAFQPLDISGIQNAQGSLGQVNAQRAADRRAKKQRQMAMAGGILGAAVAAPFAATLGVGALQAAGVGARVGSSIFTGDPVGAGTGLLGLGGMAEQAQAGSAVQGALGGFMTPGVAPGEMEANNAGIPSLTPEQQQQNAYVGALQGISKTNPAAGVQGISGLMAQRAAATTAAADRALRLRSQDITVRGQDVGSQEKAADRAQKEELQAQQAFDIETRQIRDLEARKEEARKERDSRSELEKMKVREKGESTDRMRARLLQRQMDAFNNAPGAKPLGDVELQALELTRPPDPFDTRMQRRNQPAFTPGGGQAGPTGSKFTEQNPAMPKNEADYNALPSGAVFKDPEDGRLKRKP